MIASTRSILWLCARQEMKLSVRSRWTQAFGAVFAVMAVGVAGSGYVLSGGSGFQDLGRTAASLTQLVTLLVPLASVLVATMAFTPDIGAAELLFSQPVPRRAVLVGKLIGTFVALAAAQGVGFGAAGLLVFARSGSDGLPAFLGVLAGSLVLTAVFLCLGTLVAAGHTGRHRARDLAVSVVLWFVAVVLADVAALGVASLLPSGLASRVLIVAALVNPIDAVRTATLMAIDGPSAFGVASLALLRVTGGWVGASALIAASLAAWIAGPVAFAIARLERADI